MAEKINDGGPAFPFACQGPTTAPETYYGMTLLDYFAAKAIEGAACGDGGLPDSSYCQLIAKRAYELADAMLKAREGGAS